MTKKEGKTAYQKIAEKHLLKTLPDGSMVLRIDGAFGHEVTASIGANDMKARGFPVSNPNRIKMMPDHVVPSGSSDSAIQAKILRDWSADNKIEFLEIGKENSGICHVAIPQNGWIRPGGIYIMSDSHTCTHGAFCAFAAGVGTTELEAALITGLWVCRPQKVIRVNFVGKLPANVFAKDLILELIHRIGVAGATNAVLEFGGNVIDEMSMEARMTIANMAVEAGATSGMANADQKTLDYLWPVIKEKYNEDARPNQVLRDLEEWNSDPDAEYDQVIEIDVSDMVPVATINFSVGDVVPVSEIAGKKLDQVFIGSCTNGRLEDLRIAASVIRQMGGKTAPNIRCIIVPATQRTYLQALKEGLIEIFASAGCIISGSSCAACLGMSGGVIAPGETCVSTTNRNFPGRMGKGGMVHLVSPATAAATAVKGFIIEASREICAKALEDCRRASGETAQPTGWKDVEFERPNYSQLVELAGKGQRRDFSGKVFYLPVPNIDTDQILPAEYLTKVDKNDFGKHCLENMLALPEQRTRLSQSDIMVAGQNFGCGSSREHAPWALEGIGIRCVIAPSFARIFEANMFNNGLLCIALPQEKIDLLFGKKPGELSINWEQGTVKWANTRVQFEIPEHQKHLIRSGGLIGVMIALTAELQKEGILW